jgi:hypothetical protein
MSNPQTRAEMLLKLQQDLEALSLNAAAYFAKQIKEELVRNPNATPAQSGQALEKILSAPGSDMTPSQAKRFAAQYHAVAALDKEGAGVVVFRDRRDQLLAVGVRGTDLANNLKSDLVANAALAKGDLPAKQVAHIVNFLARSTTPADQTVPQFGIKPAALNAVELAQKAALLAVSPVAAAVIAPQNKPVEPFVSGYTKGEGTALGRCKVAAGHSEGGPESIMASALLQCTRSTTYNAPHLATKDAQIVLNFVKQQLGFSAVDLTQLQTVALVGSGPKVVAGLHASARAPMETLHIPPTVNPLAAHGVKLGLLAADARLQIALDHPHMTGLEQVDKRLRTLWVEQLTAPVKAVTDTWNQAAKDQLHKLVQLNQWGTKEVEAFVNSVAKEGQSHHPAPAQTSPRLQLPERPHSPTPGVHRLQ